ncbi:MAG TPA: BTAD domain-containing putative transcriptional regulator, partial [Chthonomonadaceae bacterium]|nr:BTAD domain-containing putative transcriptional regulator [Chthonomonadaceae bacterium]
MREDEHKEMLTLRLLGTFEVLAAGQPLPRLRTRKGRWLLALLALRHHQELERSWLAGALWPESLEEQALTNLRICLFDLRRALGDQAYRLRSPSPRTLRLDVSEADVDVLTFDQAISCGKEESLQQAAALYRGPLLEGCLEEWCLLERQQREQAYLGALEKLAQQAIARTDTTPAIGHLQRIVALDPFRESAWRLLMQAHSSCGGYGAAVQVYRQLRLRLHEELHTEPDEQTQTLFRQIRQQARSAGKLSPMKGTPAENGACASLAGETQEDFPEGRQTNLPALWTRFIGREKERKDVQSLLEQTRVLTLTGIGGCGKTRLALQVAAEILEDYPDGVWLVELAALADPALVVQEISAAVGVREEAGQGLLQTLIRHLQAKQALLLVDNCEHLLPTCAALAQTLLSACSRLKVVATSREALRVTGEQVYRVPSLSAPDPLHLPRQEKDRAAIVSEYDAVRLFVDRATLHKPAFTLTQHNASAVASVCHRLDGIPLAIELAAARVPALSVEEIATRLADRFGLLTGGSRTALPRQQTLKAALDWSYDLLSPDEQQLLARLSVFAGGWTLKAAEAVCGADGYDVLDLLASLIDKSLVIAEECEGRTRYRLLETIRAYGWERLREAGEIETWCDRHLEFFLQLAETAESRILGADLAQWLERLESEHDNLRAALEWRRQEKGTSEAGLRLAGALWRFWRVRGYYCEGREHLQAALSQDGARSPMPARAKALLGAGALSAEQGDYPAARALLEQCLALRRELEDRSGMGSVLNHLGRVAYEQGDMDAARALYAESLAICREAGNKQGVASALINLAGTTRLQGDLAATRALCEEALAISRELGDKQ